MLINSDISIPFILDGATGTELTKRGMGSNDCTERFILENPNILRALQTEYINAGSDGVLVPTFGANLPTLLRHGFSADEYESICEKLFKITKENANSKKVGGDISPTGLMLKPYGDTEPEEVFNIYRKQAEILFNLGVDFFFIETMISASEAYLALRAVRAVSADIPVFVSFTVNEKGRTMNGDTMAATLFTMLPYNISGFGCNCSIGPDVVINALKPAAPIAKRYNIPLVAKPNAGMPITDENGTHFPLTPLDMANAVDELIGLGVGVFGGCCGTTPNHIKAIANAAKQSTKIRFQDVESIEEGNFVATTRVYEKVESNANYIKINSDSENDIYDILDECDPNEILYFELEEGGAELLIRMDAFIPNPIALKGIDGEIVKVEKVLCRKVR